MRKTLSPSYAARVKRGALDAGDRRHGRWARLEAGSSPNHGLSAGSDAGAGAGSGASISLRVNLSTVAAACRPPPQRAHPSLRRSISIVRCSRSKPRRIGRRTRRRRFVRSSRSSRRSSHEPSRRATAPPPTGCVRRSTRSRWTSRGRRAQRGIGGASCRRPRRPSWASGSKPATPWTRAHPDGGSGWHSVDGRRGAGSCAQAAGASGRGVGRRAPR